MPHSTDRAGDQWAGTRILTRRFPPDTTSVADSRAVTRYRDRPVARLPVAPAPEPSYPRHGLDPTIVRRPATGLPTSAAGCRGRVRSASPGRPRTTRDWS